MPLTSTARTSGSLDRGLRRPETLVLGMGLTGASCARYLAARGISACFADTRAEPPGLPAILKAMPEADILTGPALDRLPAEVSRVIVSPGVDFNVPLLREARARGVVLQSDLDLFFQERRAPVVGVTGSNGKSTVTAMLTAMFAADGWRMAAGANFGTPALDLLDATLQLYALELSSFQLERAEYLPLVAAVILNLSADHLDKHRDMHAYRAAKARIYQRCETAVVNRDAPEMGQLVAPEVPRLTFGLNRPAAGEFGVIATPAGNFLAFGDDLLMSANELNVPGSHNIANALAALALGYAAGARLPGMVRGLKAFRGLPHRMHVVATHCGITWIDDSKATNVGAAETSIRSVAGPLILVAGGDAKGQSFEALASALRGRSCVAILLGRDRHLLAQALKDACAVQLVDDMTQAVNAAQGCAAAGSTVLLAPACSSLDMFENYAARGEAFAQAVRELAS